jgi:deoxyadenosine/deoxycytidine kinase
MTNEETIKKLQKTYDRWTTGFCLSYTILDDYAEQMAKLNNEDVEVIKKRILEKASIRINKIKKDSANFF